MKITFVSVYTSFLIIEKKLILIPHASKLSITMKPTFPFEFYNLPQPPIILLIENEPKYRVSMKIEQSITAFFKLNFMCRSKPKFTNFKQQLDTCILTHK